MPSLALYCPLHDDPRWPTATLVNYIEPQNVNRHWIGALMLNGAELAPVN